MQQHTVIPADTLKRLIDHVQTVLENDYPDYELVVKEVHDYYNLPASFNCEGNILITHVSFYTKLKT